MAQSVSPLSSPPLTSPGVLRSRAERDVSGVALTHGALDALGVGEEVVVVSLALEADMAAWLRAVGIGEGDRVVVLRRAAFGGPLHVRTGAGGEFALHRTLAKSVMIRVAAPRAHEGEGNPSEGSAA